MKASELLSAREPYFTSVNFTKNEVNCGDDRDSDLDTYIHVFGGVLFVPYTILVMQKIKQPFLPNNFLKLTEQILPLLKQSGVQKPGVHSDQKAENGPHFDIANLSGPVGCGYAGLRAGISQLIFEKNPEIIDDCAALKPDLLDQNGRDFAHQVAHTHSQLASDAAAIGDGRMAVRSAAELGAHIAIFKGSHTAKFGIINDKNGSSFMTGQALAAGQPAYGHDLWASNYMLNMLRNDYPFDEKELAITSLMDIVGTMKALGVTDIALR